MQRRCAFWRTFFFMCKSLDRAKPLRGWRQPLWLAYIAAGAATQRKKLPVAVMVEGLWLRSRWNKANMQCSPQDFENGITWSNKYISIFC